MIKQRLNRQSLQYLREENERLKEEVDKELLYNLQNKINQLTHTI